MQFSYLLSLYLATTCLKGTNFNISLEGHIKPVWLYLFLQICHDITEILLKVVLNTITLSLSLKYEKLLHFLSFAWFILIFSAVTDYAGGWIAGSNDVDQYIQVDMEEAYKLTTFYLQGQSDEPNWVTAYKLYYTDDPMGNWTLYQDSTGEFVSQLYTLCDNHIIFTLCDKSFSVTWLFSRGTLISSTNKTDRHDITEILLKVALNTINHNHIIKSPKQHLETYCFALFLIIIKSPKQHLETYCFCSVSYHYYYYYYYSPFFLCDMNMFTVRSQELLDRIK